MKKPGEQDQLLPRFVEDGKRQVASARLALGKPVAKSTAKEYARRAKRVDDANGMVDLLGVGKRELALWKASIKWKAKERIREAIAEAEAVWRRSDFEREGLRWKAYEQAVKKIKISQYKLAEVETALQNLVACSKADEMKKERGHKKRPLKSGEAARFFEAVGKSDFRPAFLVALFSGARNEELSGGVRVRQVKTHDGRVALLLTIENRAKRGTAKGQPKGRILLPVDSVSGEFAPLFKELQRLVAREGGEMTVKVEPTEKMTVGVRLTKIAGYFGGKVELADGSHPSFYSLRQTFSAQVKAAATAKHGQDWEAAAVEVAQAMGHQSTETARHYGRASRGGGGFAPESRLQASVAEPVRSYGSGAGPKGRAEVKARGARAREAEAISRVSRSGMGTLKPKGI